MDIGRTIKKYRNQRDLTQEQLSEYMSVSVSAVSQWESGKTVPDVATLLSLANFFDITLDELFDRSSVDKAKVIKEYDDKHLELSNKGKVNESLAMWREAVQRFPGDFHCLGSLAHCLLSTVYSISDKEQIESNAKEAVAICERILRDCVDNNERTYAVQVLVYLYSHPTLSIASEEKAVEYAMMGGGIYVTRESLLEHAYFTDESKDKRLSTIHGNILTYMDLLTSSMYCNGWQYKNDDEKILACKTALKLWEALIYDGNYEFYHARIRAICSNLAYIYASRGNREETLEYLKKAMHHAECSDALPREERHYTSILVRGATSDASKFSKNYELSEKECALEYMQNKVFDFLRGDEEFKRMLQ